MIHVLFSSSAAGTLRQVLAERGQRGRVVDISDDLDWGPIALANFADREKWFDHHIPNDFGGWDWFSESMDRFNDNVSADPDRLIWIAPHSASEQSGLYWYLENFGGADCEMIVADYPLSEAWEGRTPLRLGELQQEAIAALLDKSPRVSWSQAQFPREKWRMLMAEDTLLRVVDGGVLRAVPPDFFDSLLLSCCPADWTKWHRVVGDTMAKAWDFNSSPSDAFLLWRLRELIKSGAIACDAPIPRYGSSGKNVAKVRLSS